MAIEVDHRRYLFLKRQKVIIMPPSFKAPTKSAAEEQNATGKEALTPAEIPRSRDVFVHNPLHDFESLDWAGINLLADRQVIGVDSGKKRQHVDTHPALDQQHEWARKLFYNIRERSEFLTSLNQFLDFIATLDPRVQPLGYFLLNITTELVDRYQTAEKDVDSIDFNVAGDLYMFFQPTMTNYINLDDYKDIRIGEIDYAALKEERTKRRRLA